VGGIVGDMIGESVTKAVGAKVGDTAGDTVGDAVGGTVGDAVGDAVGGNVGDAVGDTVGGGTSLVAIKPLLINSFSTVSRSKDSRPMLSRRPLVFKSEHSRHAAFSNARSSFPSVDGIASEQSVPPKT